MQVMPFWSRPSATATPAGLFHMQTNLRFGCVILRHYLDLEKGDLFRRWAATTAAAGRSEYPNMVLGANAAGGLASALRRRPVAAGAQAPQRCCSGQRPPARVDDRPPSHRCCGRW